MAKTFARISGWVFLLLGILGFFTSSLFGLIQFDSIQNTLHLLFGITGITFAQSRHVTFYSTWFGTLFIVIGIIGFFMPLMGSIHFEVLESLIYLLLGGWGLYTGVYQKA